jgi:hypothetical protein
MLIITSNFKCTLNVHRKMKWFLKSQFDQIIILSIIRE